MSKKGKWRQVLAGMLTCAMLLPSISAAAQEDVLSEAVQSSVELQSEVGRTHTKEATAREQVNFNREWKFIRNDFPGAEAVDFDDSEWVDIGIPHNFSIPYEMTASFYVGYGWYRKDFEIPADWADKKVELEFEGVFQEAEIYVNGQAVGTHRGGYSGFVYDITEYLQQGSNVLAVRVNNIWKPDLAPRAGDHQFTGGIYRDVYLNVTEDVHVTWYGTFVTTPDLMNPGFAPSAKNVLDSYTSEAEIRENIAKKQSNVSVSTEIKNDSSSAKNVKVKQEVVDENGKVAAVFESKEQEIAAGAVGNLVAVSEKIKGIHLWSTETPYLYKVYTTVYSEGKTVDSYESSFGFRWAQYKDDGFYLNGEKTLLNGANVHQDHAGFADAVTNEGFQRDVAMIKETGMNFIRGSHYPHDPSFAEACDEQGILFWSECNFWGMGGCGGKDDPATLTSNDWFKDAYPQNPADEEAFEQSCMDSLEAMIRVNRNHPSVINWSMGNEAFFTNGGMDNYREISENGTAPKALALVDKMRNRSHTLDPTRKAGMGGAQRGGYESLDYCDIAGYNGDGGTFIPKVPMPHVVAEYGSEAADRPGKYRPFYHVIQGADEYSYKLVENSAGLILWCGFHHGTIGGDGLAKMGIIDYYRLPLNSWYWYRNNLRGIAPEASKTGKATQMEITSSEESITNDGRKDTQLIVTMKDANGNWVNETKAVTLKVESGPGIFPGGKTYKFIPNKSIRDGKASIEFRSYYSGDTVISATADGLPVSTITVHTDKTVSEEGEEPQDFYNADKWGSITAKIPEPTLYGSNNAASGRPLFPSSNNQNAALGADGNLNTSWVAGKAGNGEYFMVDLEFALYLYKIKIGFSQTPYPYKVESSTDRNGPWTLIVDYTNETVGSRKIEETIDGLEGRFVKITFTDVPETEKAFLSELEVYGNPSSVTPQYNMDSVYLSEVVDYNNDVTTGYGNKRKNQSCDGNPIQVGGKTYEKGIGLHADSTVRYKLNQKYTRISGVAGIDNEVSGGNAIFRIFADSSLIYEKELSGGEADEFNLSVSGAAELRLVTDANGANSQDHTDWADVKLYGAIRDISLKGSSVKTSYVGMSAGYRAGENFEGIINLTNNGDTQRTLCTSLSFYNKEGKLADYRMEESSLYPKGTKDITLALPMPGNLDGYEGRVSVWDRDTMELLANAVVLYPDPNFMESGEKTETEWTKVDGEDKSLDKVGAWKLYSAEDAYMKSETFIGDPGNPVKDGDYIALTFTGNYIKVGAKVDGGQVGADVYIDDIKAGEIKNNGSAGVYKEVYASEKLSDGEHTIKLMPKGKFGLDYFEYGLETTTVGGGQEPDADHPILVAMSILTKQIEAGKMAQYTLSGRKAAADSILSAYLTYRNPAATDNETKASADHLNQVIKNLKEKEDTTALAELLAKVKAMISKGQGNYTDESFAKLKSAAGAAEKVLAKAEPTAAEIKSASDALNSAVAGLQLKPNNAIADAKNALQAEINASSAIVKKGQQHYTAASFKNFKDRLTVAQKVFNDGKATLEQLKSACTALTSARTNLAIYKVPKKGSKHTIGNLKYKVVKSSAANGTVSVTGSKKKSLKSISIPATITISSYRFKVTEIANKAFYKNNSLRSVTIGSSVTTIGQAAFYGDRRLTSIKINSAVLKTVKKNALKQINSKAVIRVPAKKLQKYKGLFKKKGQASTVKIKK